jgi:hypothetical protein
LRGWEGLPSLLSSSLDQLEPPRPPEARIPPTLSLPSPRSTPFLTTFRTHAHSEPTQGEGPLLPPVHGRWKLGPTDEHHQVRDGECGIVVPCSGSTYPGTRPPSTDGGVSRVVVGDCWALKAVAGRTGPLLYCLLASVSGLTFQGRAYSEHTSQCGRPFLPNYSHS